MTHKHHLAGAPTPNVIMVWLTWGPIAAGWRCWLSNIVSIWGPPLSHIMYDTSRINGECALCLEVAGTSHPAIYIHPISSACTMGVQCWPPRSLSFCICHRHAAAGTIPPKEQYLLLSSCFLPSEYGRVHRAVVFKIYCVLDNCNPPSLRYMLSPYWVIKHWFNCCL